MKGVVVSFSSYDAWLFKEGTNYSLYNLLGAHLDGDKGCHFALWAPNAKSVSVIGDFNHWQPSQNKLHLEDKSVGIWEGFVREVKRGDKYKYHVVSHDGQYAMDKGDPFATFWEAPPGTASIVWDLSFNWQNTRRPSNDLTSPMAIYEIHHPSWRRVPEEQNRPLTYLELAQMLPQYLRDMGFTHVEFLPVMEHPFYGSWGYQTCGYFAPSSRYGTPQEFMYLIDSLHTAGIAVILDWVPSHFPTDVHGLAYYDGTHLYEHPDSRRRMQPDWNTFLFNYDHPQVQSFLISNALFWFEKYHIDGLRIDAVSSMLYLDFSKGPGAWMSNIYGGHENLGAIQCMQKLNRQVYQCYPHAQTIAEESTA
ncbi:MAG: 1,4-alpha-glucan branching enzyme, partial [Verrucomicrobia bacterium]|nr:1,4-alpha-glucan branching enzyme [Verrucomicrobiota bacterium]